MHSTRTLTRTRKYTHTHAHTHTNACTGTHAHTHTTHTHHTHTNTHTHTHTHTYRPRLLEYFKDAASIRLDVVSASPPLDPSFSCFYSCEHSIYTSRYCAAKLSDVGMWVCVYLRVLLVCMRGAGGRERPRHRSTCIRRPHVAMHEHLILRRRARDIRVPPRWSSCHVFQRRQQSRRTHSVSRLAIQENGAAYVFRTQ